MEEVETLNIMGLIDEAERSKIVRNGGLLFKKIRQHLIVLNPQFRWLVRYDLEKKEMQRLRKDGEWHSVEHQYEFFRNKTVHDVECDDNKFLELLKASDRLNPNCYSLSTLLGRMDKALVYENYFAHGINVDVSPYGKLKHPPEFYPKEVLDFLKKTNYEVDDRFERAFETNKQLATDVIKYISKREDSNDPERLDSFIRGLLGYNMRLVTTLTETHKYDLKSLLNYLIDYLDPFEGVRFGRGLELLDDYYRMASSIGRKVKKYPKYLHSMHDIIQVNYKAAQKEYDEVYFAKIRKKELDHKGVKFCIITPKKPKEILSEGASLNHCVASYVPKIIKGETYIFFMRTVKEPKDSLLTLEFRDGALVQAKGSYNRLPTDEEYKFLRSYCKKKKIKYGLGGD